MLHFQEPSRCWGLSGASPFPTKQSQESAHKRILSDTLAAWHTAVPWWRQLSWWFNGREAAAFCSAGLKLRNSVDILYGGGTRCLRHKLSRFFLCNCTLFAFSKSYECKWCLYVRRLELWGRCCSNTAAGFWQSFHAILINMMNISDVVSRVWRQPVAEEEESDETA